MTDNPLTELETLPFGDAWFMACTHVRYALSKLNQVRLGMDLGKDIPYLNSGVILYNLPAFREGLDIARIHDYAEEKKSALVLPDQDILTAVCGEHVRLLDPLRYNLAAMIARFNETGRSQVLAKRMPGDLSEYSVIQTKEPMVAEGQVARIVEFIEKPDEPQTLDSDLMAVGRYVLSADIWAELERTEPGAWGRIQLTDAIAELAKKQSVDAMLMTGESYDCGKKMGYMQAFVTYGMRNLKEGAKFRESIKKLLA